MKRIILVLMFLFFASIASADEYYIGQWVWNDTDKDFKFWEAPLKEQCIGVLDLRSREDKNGDGIVKGYAVFAYKTTVTHPNLKYIGGTNSLSVSASIKTDIKTDLKLESDVIGNTPKKIIYNLITEEGDDIGIAVWKKFKPNSKGELKIGEVDLAK